ncbi:MAG: hypothetical protein ACREA0_35025 [bacterium]
MSLRRAALEYHETARPAK